MLKLNRRFSFVPFGLAGATLVVIACGTSSNNTEEEPTSDSGPSPTNETDATVASGDDSSVVSNDSGIMADSATLTKCTKSAECPSNVCDIATGECLTATCKDGTRNQDETDVDCGGAICGKCDIQKKCDIAEDCASGVCLLESGVRKCQQPACDDGVKNGNETGIDCGGSCGKCDDNVACGVAADCKSDVCSGGKCLTPSCNDGAKNGTDTDIDCGGPSCPRCADTKMCLANSDCVSGVCSGGTCQIPKDSDGVKNGTETDTDCGGAGNKACDVGKHCDQPTDCASTACNYGGTCVTKKSCSTHYGGDTCGLGGEGGTGPAEWEDCCKTGPVTVGGTTTYLGKYPVTAGRMRTFLESVNYDVRGFVQTTRGAGQMPSVPEGATSRSVLEADWDMYLPTSFYGSTAAGELTDVGQGGGAATPGIYTAILRHLGGFIFKNNAQGQTGCFAGAPGTHSFRFPDNSGETVSANQTLPEADQALYDMKTLNCVNYLVAQAFCVWDGGRLESLAEWKAAVGTAGTPWVGSQTATVRTPGATSYWGCRFPWATDLVHPANCGNWNAPASIEYADYQYSYEYPQLQATDYIVFLAIPGRTRGRGTAGGHADLYGAGFEHTSTLSVPTGTTTPFTAKNNWSGNGSWEVHSYNRYGQGGSATTAATFTMLLNKYGKLGARCAYPTP